MQKRLFKITALLLFIFSGHFASGSNKSFVNYPENTKKATFLKESLSKNPHNPYNYECIVNTLPLQLNLQQHRNVHFWQVVNNGPHTYTITVKYLNFICGQGNSELSLFRKLILFPFHVFW
jgi:hypothetical protein